MRALRPACETSIVTNFVCSNDDGVLDLGELKVGFANVFNVILNTYVGGIQTVSQREVSRERMQATPEGHIPFVRERSIARLDRLQSPLQRIRSSLAQGTGPRGETLTLVHVKPPLCCTIQQLLGSRCSSMYSGRST